MSVPIKIMSDEGFFIYLSSREDKSIFTNNEASGFTNKITPNLILRDEYVVALSSIAFSPDYYCIKKNDPAFFININIKTFNENGLIEK